LPKEYQRDFYSCLVKWGVSITYLKELGGEVSELQGQIKETGDLNEEKSALPIESTVLQATQPVIIQCSAPRDCLNENELKINFQSSESLDDSEEQTAEVPSSQLTDTR